MRVLSTLVPHVYRARYRRHCRNFVNKTFEEIVSSVLENKWQSNTRGKGGLSLLNNSAIAPPQDANFQRFDEPFGGFRWVVRDDARIKDRSAYPYVAQYNESDFDFVSRMLEHEGLSYVFEHLDSSSIMTICDRPTRKPLSPMDEVFERRRINRSGSVDNRNIVRSLRDARRLRERSVTMRDFDYHRSLTLLQDTQSSEHGSESDNYFEFPAGEESVVNSPTQHAAQIRMQRTSAERVLREGSSDIRTMEHGVVVTLRDADGISKDQSLLPVRIETFAIQRIPEDTILDEEPFGFAGHPMMSLVPGSYDNRFVALEETVQFRPAMTTPQPRIHGVQTAVVTSEEFAGQRPKINSDRLGRVRVRFPWDQRADAHDQTPTSDWLRVSQFWAGSGYGSLETPRVGHEVLVAYHQGDPSRPVVIGRVYNGQNVPPYDAGKEPTKSTLKSQSATGTHEVEGFNELRFEDHAHREEIYLHAQRDLNEIVLSNHSTNVGGNQTNTVGGFREHRVDGTEQVTVGQDRTTHFKAGESHTVDHSRNTLIKIDETLHVSGQRQTYVHRTELHEVKGKLTTRVESDEDHFVWGNRETDISKNDTLDIKGDQTTTVKGTSKLTAHEQFVEIKGSQEIKVGGAATYTATTKITHVVDDSTLTLVPGAAKLSNDGNVDVNGAKIVLKTLGGTAVSLEDGQIAINTGGAAIAIVGDIITIVGGTINIVGRNSVNITSPTINLDPK